MKDIIIDTWLFFPTLYKVLSNSDYISPITQIPKRNETLSYRTWEHLVKNVSFKRNEVKALIYNVNFSIEEDREQPDIDNRLELLVRGTWNNEVLEIESYNKYLEKLK